MPLSGQLPSDFGSMGIGSNLQGTTGTNNASSASPCPSHTVSSQPLAYHVSFHSSTAPTETTCVPSHLSFIRHPPSVVENQSFNSREWSYQVFLLPVFADSFRQLHEHRGFLFDGSRAWGLYKHPDRTASRILSYIPVQD